MKFLPNFSITRNSDRSFQFNMVHFISIITTSEKASGDSWRNKCIVICNRREKIWACNKKCSKINVELIYPEGRHTANQRNIPQTSTCVSLCEFIYQKTSWIFSPSLACKWAQMSLIKTLLINSLREAVLSVDLKNLKKKKTQFHAVHFSAINFVLVSNSTVFIPAKCQTCYRYSFEVCFFKEF